MFRRRARTPKTKKIQKRHIKYRFIQRVGVGLTEELYKKILRGIRNGKYEHAEKQSNRVSVYKVPLEGKDGLQDYYIVYDKHRISLVTVLTKQMFEEGFKD